MVEANSAMQRVGQDIADRVTSIWDNLGKNNLWKRILKNVIATTAMVSIALIPGTKNAVGKAAYLGAITTVFGHPGRRFGQMAEALILAISGTLLGTAWATLGVYLSSLVIEKNPPAAYTVRGLFLTIVVLIHGYLRSRTPRLFNFVLLMVIVNVVTLLATSKKVTRTGVTQILYPILIAGGVIILVNVCVFPEFSSSFLGQKTIETLDDTMKALENAGKYFVGAQDSKDEGASGRDEKGTPSDASDSKTTSYSKKAGPSTKPSFLDRMRKVIGWDQLRGTSDAALEEKETVTVSSLTADKTAIRGKAKSCKEAQSECNFELAFSVLPPGDLKPISVTAMKKLAANTIAVIGTCESKFALLGEEKGSADDAQEQNKGAPEQDDTEKDKTTPVTPAKEKGLHQTEADGPEGEQSHESSIAEEQLELERIKPRREIEFGDARLLQYLQRRIAKPYQQFQLVINQVTDMIKDCLAYTYDVPELPSGKKPPKFVVLEDLDLQMDVLQRAMARFDVDCASTLETAAMIQDSQGLEPDIMPREEIFLISSFILNVRQAATHIETMLDHTRMLVANRQEHRRRRRPYAPRIKLASWLATGSAEDESAPSGGRKAVRKDQMNAREDDDDIDVLSMSSRRVLLGGQQQQPVDLEKNPKPEAAKATKTPSKVQEKSRKPDVHTQTPQPKSKILWLRAAAADALEWIQDSDDLLYAFKLSISIMLLVWPAFVTRWNDWYSLNRGLWGVLQLVFVADVTIGSSVNVFILRAIGTTLGCLWGWAAYEARNGNRIVCAAMICIGIFPCAYVQLGTKYPKSGMVAIVSMSIVALATELETVPGSGTENFLKRYIAFTIGGFAALIIQVAILPVRARTRMVEALIGSLQQMIEMEKCIAYGIEQGMNLDLLDVEIFLRFDDASSKANGALLAAETFLPMCSLEPRVKGSFDGLALIYTEIIFVLHQIIDRMDNMLQLRIAFGSGPLEELNAEIYRYRRNVAGSVTLTLFAVRGALMTKLPLPQFLPSARLSHLRLINRVREVVLEKAGEDEQESDEITAKLARQRATRRKFMSWNGSSAAQVEVIEYLEELVDLTKLLVGANEFNSGLLARENYAKYVAQGNNDSVDSKGDHLSDVEEEEENEAVSTTALESNDAAAGQLSKRRTTTDTERRRDTRNVMIGQRRRTIVSPNTTATPNTNVQASNPTGVAKGVTGSGQTRPTTTATTNTAGLSSSVSSSRPSDEVPASLKRIQTRKIEAGLRRQRTNDSSTGMGSGGGGGGGGGNVTGLTR